MTSDVQVLPPPRPRRLPPVIESEVLAVLIFVGTELMLFAGFISAYQIVGARAAFGEWPPPWDPALPVRTTAVATVALTLSGVAMYLAGRTARANAAHTLRAMIAALVLASGFVVYQLVEAVRMVGQGLTIHSSAHGSFVYLIVGLHAVHCVIALAILGWAITRQSAGTMSPHLLQAVRVFWYFVVGLWPILYAMVYL